MTSPLPPKRRDSRNLADLIRQDRTRLSQIDHGLVGGRYSPARPLKPRWDDGAEDDFEDESLNFLNTDRATAGGPGNATMHLTYAPVDGSEHVSWHPNGHGGLHLPASAWVRTDQALTILAFDGLSAGDLFTCEYAYLDGEPDPINPSVVGYTTPGVWDSTAKTMTYAIPTGTVAGDALVLSVRGSVGPGGGELTDGLSCSDPRMTLVYAATLVNGSQSIIERVWIGTANGSGSPIVVNVANSTYAGQARGVLAAITGVNGFGTVTAVEPGVGGSAPTTSGVAAVAVTWLRVTTFGAVTAVPPTGYTDISSSGSDYYSTDLSFWYDSAADPATSTTPTGTFTGEGCCVITLI